MEERVAYLEKAFEEHERQATALWSLVEELQRQVGELRKNQQSGEPAGRNGQLGPKDDVVSRLPPQNALCEVTETSALARSIVESAGLGAAAALAASAPAVGDGLLAALDKTRGPRTYKFEPGPLGLTIDWRTGMVSEILEGNQAARVGVRQGWYVSLIDGLPFRKDMLLEKRTGSELYSITLQKEPAFFIHVILAGGAEGDETGFKCLSTVEAYNTVTGKWSKLPPMPSPRTRCAALATSQHVYIVGGYDEVADEPVARNRPITLFQRFDPTSKEWEEMPTMGRIPMTQSPTAAAVDQSGRFYTLGGRNCELLERFDPAAGGWEALPSRPPISKGAGCVAVMGGDKLFVTGGVDNATRVDVWDPSSGEWAELPPLPSPRIQCAAAFFGTQLYIIGGRNSDSTQPLATVEAFDVSTGAWTQLPDMPTARAFSVALAVSDEIYVIGGRVAGQRVNVMESYSLVSRSWSTLPPMPTPRSGCAAAAVRM